MSKLSNDFVILGDRPNSKISDARSKISIVSDQAPPIQLATITHSISSAIRLDSAICNVCLQRKPNDQFSALSNCTHLFCNDCLSLYLTSKIFINQINIKCLDEECNQQLNETCKVFVALPQNLKTQYFKFKQNKYVMRNPLLSYCPTPQCTQVMQRFNQHESFYCAQCKRYFCPVCLLEQHIGQCDSHAELYLKNNYQYKKCPKCKMIVQKIDGCDHITCTCGYEFCYNCGGRYTPQHTCWFYEQLDVDEPLSRNRRLCNHLLLPYAVILIIVLSVVLFALIQVLLVVIVPFFAAYEALRNTSCNCLCKLIITILGYPFILLGTFIYGQTFVYTFMFGWWDFAERIVAYLWR